MPELQLAEEFQAALRLAADDADVEGMTSREAAERFYRSDRKLTAPFREEWIVEKLTALFRDHRARKRREQDRQYQLVGFRPPKVFTLPDGSKMEWSKATARALIRGRSVAYQKHKDYRHPAVRRFDKAIEFLEPFASEQHGITWEQAVEIAPEPAEGAKKK